MTDNSWRGTTVIPGERMIRVFQHKSYLSECQTGCRFPCRNSGTGKARRGGSALTRSGRLGKSMRILAAQIIERAAARIPKSSVRTILTTARSRRFTLSAIQATVFAKSQTQCPWPPG